MVGSSNAGARVPPIKSRTWQEVIQGTPEAKVRKEQVDGWDPGERVYPIASELPGLGFGSAHNLAEFLLRFGCISCKPQRVGICPLSLLTVFIF